MEPITLQSAANVREERAKKILQKGTPETIDAHTYLVPSQFSDKKYKVTHYDGYTCECEDFKQRCAGTGLYCKHIKAIILFQSVKNAYEVEESVKQEVEHIADSEESCPFCHSANIIRRGVRKTTTEERQRYACKECGKRFVLSPIKSLKGNAKYVCLAMDCYYKGLSYRDIADQFKQFYGLNLSHETIRQWVLRFGSIMAEYSTTLKPATSGLWNADETLIRTKKGDKAQGGDYENLWNVIDNKTKFLLASVTSGHSRNIGDAMTVMEEAWEQSKERPEAIITDRNPSYQEGIRHAFKNWADRRTVQHVSIVGKRKLINNNAVENDHTHQKEFHKVRRGVNEVQGYADGFKVFHNFIRQGVKDHQTPAERCGIGVDGNRWETLLITALKAPQLTTDGEEVKSP